MMVIIIGKNRVEFCSVKKKDLTKHFYTTRGQLYKVYPDALRPMEIYKNGAWVRSESVIVFEENGTEPYKCKYLEDYGMDAILSSIDEHKIMSGKKKAYFEWMKGAGFKEIMNNLPLIIVGVVLVIALIGGFIFG